jgi:hypothetical protein
MFLSLYVLIICLERINTAKRLTKNLSLTKPKLPTHNSTIIKNDNHQKNIVAIKKVLY